MSKIIRAWHFTGPTLRDGRTIPSVGEWLVHEGQAQMCKSGLHASKLLLDAAKYAPGLTLHRVECADVVQVDKDKLLCRRRRIVGTLRPERTRTVLQWWARVCALTVIDRWNAPDVVRQWLVTGDPTLHPVAYAYSAAAPAAAAAYSAAYSAAFYAAHAAAASVAYAAFYAAHAAAVAAGDAADAYAADAAVAAAAVQHIYSVELERRVLAEMGKPTRR